MHEVLCMLTQDPPPESVVIAYPVNYFDISQSWVFSCEMVQMTMSLLLLKILFVERHDEAMTHLQIVLHGFLISDKTGDKPEKWVS